MLSFVALLFQIVVKSQLTFELVAIDRLCHVLYDCWIEKEDHDDYGSIVLVFPLERVNLLYTAFDAPEKG